MLGEIFYWIFNMSIIASLMAFLGDVEMACDEAAIAKYEEKDRKEYARTLLDCARGKACLCQRSAVQRSAPALKTYCPIEK